MKIFYANPDGISLYTGAHVAGDLVVAPYGANPKFSPNLAGMVTVVTSGPLAQWVLDVTGNVHGAAWVGLQPKTAPPPEANIASLGGPGVTTEGDALYTLSSGGTQRNVLDDGSGDITVTGTVHAEAVAPSGLAGAVASSRYAGATVSGAPTSGTFAAGDFVVDQTGKMWVCTVSGTPGTWVQIGSAGGTMIFVDQPQESVTGQSGAAEMPGTSGASSSTPILVHNFSYDSSANTLQVTGTTSGATYAYILGSASPPSIDLIVTESLTVSLSNNGTVYYNVGVATTIS